MVHSYCVFYHRQFYRIICCVEIACWFIKAWSVKGPKGHNAASYACLQHSTPRCIRRKRLSRAQLLFCSCITDEWKFK